MEKMNSLVKEAGYKLLDVYQTNSPVYCDEAVIRRNIDEQYADALFKFVFELQRMFALQPVFNQPQNAKLQKEKIKSVFRQSFSCYPKEELDELFYFLLRYLIGGLNNDFNFAYGLKLYALFKNGYELRFRVVSLFRSRLENNILSRYYTEHPTVRCISSEDWEKYFEQPMARKLQRYKVFSKQKNRL